MVASFPPAVRPFLSLLLLVLLLLQPSATLAISSCNGPCRTLNDCAGQLICINGRCADDPNVGTHICTSTPPTSGGCNAACKTLNDCAGQLICINGRCADDPNVGTHICTSTPPPPPPSTSPPPPPSTTPPPPTSGSCSSSGTLTCNGVSYPTYTCSPPVSSSTAALLTLNDFSQGGDGGAPSECDNSYHANSELVVALSTGWYAGGSRCGMMIRITASNGRSTTAKVVDECDSVNGCDAEHAGQPPCRNNIVDGSSAVWVALGLDQNLGVVPVTWSMA